VAPVAGLPSFHSDHCYRWPHITRDLVWTDAALLGGRPATGSVVFEDLGWVVDRRMLGSTIAAFSARAGHNAEPHNQNDLGHFVLHVGGDSLLADLGAGVYTRQYFGPTRYDHIHNSSEGHSVPRINGRAQMPGAAYAARVLRCEEQPDGMLFEIELANAYDVPGLLQLQRSFRWSAEPGAGTAHLELRDRVRFEAAPASFEELFISLHKPEIGEQSVTWAGSNGRVVLQFEPSQWDASLEQIESHNHGGDPITIYRVQLAARTPCADAEYHFDFTCQAPS
jgi:hypothetical protein